MNLLFDTCTFIWHYSNPTQLSARAAALLVDSGNTLWLSTASVWEIIVKNRRGRAVVTGDLEQIVHDQVTSNRVQLLSLKLEHVLVNRTLPTIHADPFDRILICQALAEGLTILTPDHHIRRYAVPTDW